MGRDTSRGKKIIAARSLNMCAVLRTRQAMKFDKTKDNTETKQIQHHQREQYQQLLDWYV